MAENLNLNVNVNTSGAEGSVGSLKKQLREAQAEVASLAEKFGVTSKEAINAAKRAGELRDRIGDAKAMSDAFNPDAKFKALTASLSGVAGGFGAVQGAMALFGNESENVQKTLLKVQSAMALSQGLQSLGESIDSFKNLGAVIKSTTLYQTAYNFVMGEGVAVTKTTTVATVEQTVALEAEAVATTEVAVATTGATIALRLFRAALVATGIGAIVVGVGMLIEYMTSLSGATEKARIEKEKLDKAYVEGSKKSYNQYLEDLDSLKEIELAKAGDNENAKFNIEEDFRKKKIAALEKQSKEIEGKGVEAEGELQKQIAKLRDEGTINSYANERRLKKLLEEKKIQDEIDAALKEKKAIDDALAEYEKRKKKSSKLDTDPIGTDGLTADERAKAKENEIALHADTLKKTQELTQQSSKDGFGKMLEDKAVAYIKNQEIDTQNLEDKRNLADLEVQNKEDTANRIADITSGLSNIIGQETAAGKAIAIASATIDTYLSASTIFKQAAKSPITVINPAYPYLMAAPAVLAGIARVKQISSVNIPRGGGAGGGMPSMSGQAPMVPQTPQAQTTNISQQSINDIGNQAVRAYVIESDVTSNQQRIAAIRERARFS
jgi:primosomal protein N''